MRARANMCVCFSRVPTPIPDTEAHANMGHTASNLFSRSFLDGVNLCELLVEQKIVENLQRTGEEKGHIDPGGPREHEPDELRADGCARGARDSRKSTRGRSLFGRNSRRSIC